MRVSKPAPRSRPPLMDETVKIEIVSGVEGQSLYLGDYRIAGPKPWGGGTVVKTFTARRKDVEEAMRLHKAALKAAGS